MATEFPRIAEVVRKHPDGKLTTLAHFINTETLEKSYHKQSGAKATGVDGETKEQYG